MATRPVTLLQKPAEAISYMEKCTHTEEARNKYIQFLLITCLMLLIRYATLNKACLRIDSPQARTAKKNPAFYCACCVNCDYEYCRPDCEFDYY